MNLSKECLATAHCCRSIKHWLLLRIWTFVAVVMANMLVSHNALAQTTEQLLRDNEISTLESNLERLQSNFEAGNSTEIELRNAFRPFYRLDDESVKNLKKWATAFPTSYAAHLALGIYYKRVGSEARGEKYISQTPQENIELMDLYLKLATKELNASLSMTSKPYLSVFHLLTISMMYGDAVTSKKLLIEGNRLLPNNTLVRNRYIGTLMPRWGGSYDLMDKFISESRAQNVPITNVYQLEAIKEDDMGIAERENHSYDAALVHFAKALLLADKVGGTFAVDYLPDSLYYGCTGKQQPLSCGAKGQHY